VNYVYEGPGPHQDPEIGLVRPGDVRDFDEEPAWGPWRKLSEAIAEPPPPVLSPETVAWAKETSAASPLVPPVTPKEM
jgi:hypothetical protein